MIKLMLTFIKKPKMNQTREYVDSLAVLNNGKTVKILDFNNFKFYVKDLDGNVQECYYDNIKFIWNK